jgi:hypothetical protein
VTMGADFPACSIDRASHEKKIVWLERDSA